MHLQQVHLHQLQQLHHHQLIILNFHASTKNLKKCQKRPFFRTFWDFHVHAIKSIIVNNHHHLHYLQIVHIIFEWSSCAIGQSPWFILKSLVQVKFIIISWSLLSSSSQKLNYDEFSKNIKKALFSHFLRFLG